MCCCRPNTENPNSKYPFLIITFFQKWGHFFCFLWTPIFGAICYTTKTTTGFFWCEVLVMWQLKPFSHTPLSVSSNCKNLKHKIRNKIYYKQMGLFGFEWLTQFFIFLPKAIFINFFYGGDTSRQLLNSSIIAHYKNACVQ